MNTETINEINEILPQLTQAELDHVKAYVEAILSNESRYP